MSILKAKNINKRYSSRGRSIEALHDVSLSLEEGELLGIVGESGSGKSTLLRIISGLEAPDSGSIFCRGAELGARRSRSELRLMQMIFQDASASFQPRRRICGSIRDSVKSLLGHAGNVDINALSALVGLDSELASRYPGELSGGQCQRFAIARAVAVRPQILLCDEITSALDVSTQAQVLRLIKDICSQRNMSVLFVSHDLAVVSELCSRVIVMKDGEIVESGKCADIISSPRHDYTKALLSSVMKIK